MTQSMSTSNAPYRLKVAVLDATDSIGPYANFSVAPRSVPKFTVVFGFSFSFLTECLRNSTVLSPVTTRNPLDSFRKLKEKHKNCSKLGYRPRCNWESCVRTYTTTSFEHGNFQAIWSIADGYNTKTRFGTVTVPLTLGQVLYADQLVT